MRGSYLMVFIFCMYIAPVLAQKSIKHSNQASSSEQKIKNDNSSGSYSSLFFQGLRWRNIGPWRGGRSLAVCGVINQPNVYYFGAVGGGVWKTTDGGKSWLCISDSAFHSSSVGAIAVAPSDPNIIYAGMGEAEMRGNISFGDGIYKSMDAGKTWKHVGLQKSYAIQNIAIHPQNPDVLYASCMGKIFGSNSERGVYRSQNGGKTWQQILFADDSTGCYDVKFDPANPMIMYASMWQALRTPYSLSSGGKGSALYKSYDGGDHWKMISQNPGLPVGIVGKITTAISTSNPNRIYAMIENENGGLYRSEDGGEHWSQINTDKNLRQRPWYFSQIYADPQNQDRVIVLNVQAWQSKDGGKTFLPVHNNHGDNHELWWNPFNSNNWIQGDDGGGEITYDGGETFTDLDFPTAQFYHVTLDNDFPYNVYGAQQDNTSIRIASRTDNFTIDANSWYPVAGGEAGYIVSDPLNSEITYGGEYDGQLSTYNKKTNQYQSINPWPEAWIGSGAESKQYRFNWTYPIIFSPHNPKELFVTSQYVHRTFDAGFTWQTISPDLTRHDPKTIHASGGPITKDNTGAEVYADIFAFAESYVQPGVFWTGSDDGLIYVSKDDGKNWNNVSISYLPDWALISIIEPSHFDAASCYVAATRYKSDDTKPYLFKTNDLGKTWKPIINGIPPQAYTRCIREDPNHKGLLYAGTEAGIYVSFDDGSHWQSLQLNLPLSPIHDIQVQKRDKDLVIATHGRAFWILDDLTPLYEMADEAGKSNTLIKNSSHYFFKPRDAYRMQGGNFYDQKMQTGENAPNGILMHYYLKNKPKKELRLMIFTNKNDTVITYSNTKDKKGESIKISKEFYEDKKMKRPGILPVDSGMNTFVWDMRWPDAKQVEGTNIMWAGSVTGPQAIPGNYRAKMLIGDSVIAEQTFAILKDPRISTSDSDYMAQFDLLKKINTKLTETHEGINRINKAEKQINDYVAVISDTSIASKFKKVTKPLTDSLDAIKGELYDYRATSPQDVLNFPIRLNDKLAGVGSVVSSADTRPTKSSYEAFNDISSRVDVQLNKLKKILEEKIPEFNKMVDEFRISPVNVK
ncbi:MAG: glycosyl hydrolase [Chitinophagales bacterium]|nr:glycosyl hydrolase [Chitinophagales bacterium]